MSASWNFARRPFRDERPVLTVLVVAGVIGLVLLGYNVLQYRRFSKGVAGTRAQIALLDARAAIAAKDAEAARRALNNYKLSSLAQQSAGLQKIVRERRFSWVALLGKLERTLPPDVRLARLTPQFESPDAVRVDLALLGRNPETVVRTLAALSKDPAFQAVDLHSESNPEKGVPEGYSFHLALRYTPPETLR